MPMARIAILGALALVMAVGAAPPAAAQSSEERSARKLAVKLARTVAADRGAVFWDLSPAVKVRSNRIVFLYSERTPDEFFCTAKLVVTRSGRTRRAELASQRCRAIPEEALAVEREIRSAIRAVRAKRSDVARSLREYELEMERCDELEPPLAVRGDIDLFIDAGLELSIFEPALPELDRFVAALEAIGASDPVLRAGIVSVRRWLALLGQAPAGARESCAQVRSWARAGYSDDEAPAGLRDVRVWTATYERQIRRMLRAIGRLAQLGLSERTAGAFLPHDLVGLAVGD
jgi:hypothetical protein